MPPFFFFFFRVMHGVPDNYLVICTFNCPRRLGLATDSDKEGLKEGIGEKE